MLSIDSDEQVKTKWTSKLQSTTKYALSLEAQTFVRAFGHSNVIVCLLKTCDHVLSIMNGFPKHLFINNKNDYKIDLL